MVFEKINYSKGEKIMPDINTLIPDIYKTLEEGVNTGSIQNRDALQKFANAVYQSARRSLSEEDNKQRSKKNLRMSQIGKPDRQLWYDMQENIEVENLSGQTKLKFLYGEILEALVILLTEVSGHEVSEEQKEVEVQGIKGHKDCRIDGLLVDIKSASPYGFKKFKEGTLGVDDPFGYIAQISGYAEATNDKQAAFLAIDKSNADLALLKIEDVHMINASERINKVKHMVKQATPPEKCYSDEPDGKSGNRKLVIGCVFCPHKERCWSDANGGQGLRAFQYSNGVRYLTQVGKVPDVQEINLG